MTTRAAQALAVYREHRFVDQLGWYTGRAEEYEAAKGQVVTISGVLLFLAGACGFLASSNLAGLRSPLAILATIFSAMATAVAAYDALIGHEHVAKLYRDAASSLDSLRVQLVGLATAPSDEAVKQFVEQVEAVFRREAGQWGQLTTAPQPAPTPGPGGEGQTPDQP